jgi:aspartate racemase
MKIVGIIGGLGPETTSTFYLKLIFACFEKDKTKRPPILMWSVPIDYQIEEDLITKGIGEERYVPFLIDAARRLENGGADFIVIPCNSVHIFINDVRNAVKIPVLSIVEETSQFLTDKNINRIGLLATKATVDKKLYQNILEKEGISINLPEDPDQKIIGELINNLVRSKQDVDDKEKLIQIIQKFVNKGTKDIILACTDLQLLSPTYPNTQIFDTMEILLNSTVEKLFEN